MVTIVRGGGGFTKQIILFNPFRDLAAKKLKVDRSRKWTSMPGMIDIYPSSLKVWFYFHINNPKLM
jgi:hypothetical protein